MIRVGAGKAGGAAITGAGKSSGRGAYVCPNSECLTRARKSGGLDRVLRVKVRDDLYNDLELEIKRRQKVSVG